MNAQPSSLAQNTYRNPNPTGLRAPGVGPSEAMLDPSYINGDLHRPYHNPYIQGMPELENMLSQLEASAAGNNGGYRFAGNPGAGPAVDIMNSGRINPNVGGDFNSSQFQDMAFAKEQQEEYANKQANFEAILPAVATGLGVGLVVAGLCLFPFTFGGSTSLVAAGATALAAGSVSGGVVYASRGEHVKYNERNKFTARDYLTDNQLDGYGMHESEIRNVINEDPEQLKTLPFNPVTGEIQEVAPLLGENVLAQVPPEQYDSAKSQLDEENKARSRINWRHQESQDNAVNKTLRRKFRNNILGIGGISGLVAGGLFIISNPVGWFTGATLATAALGVGIGAAGGWLYSKMRQPHIEKNARFAYLADDIAYDGQLNGVTQSAFEEHMYAQQLRQAGARTET